MTPRTMVEHGTAHIRVSGDTIQNTILASQEEMVDLREVSMQEAMDEEIGGG